MYNSKIMEITEKQLSLSIKYLPNDLVTKVIACVGSSSLIDLFNAKQRWLPNRPLMFYSCKKFHKVGGDPEVLRRISLEKLPVIPWRVSYEYSSFLKQCEESGNPEALFRRGMRIPKLNFTVPTSKVYLGGHPFYSPDEAARNPFILDYGGHHPPKASHMVDYFSLKRQESGVEFLKRATGLGCVEAAYVLGVILLCIDDRSMMQGVELLNTVDKGSPSRNNGIKECRKRSKMIIHQMWINSFLTQSKPMCNKSICTGKRGTSGWLSIEDEELPSCEACRWDREVVLFCNMLHGI